MWRDIGIGVLSVAGAVLMNLLMLRNDGTLRFLRRR